MNTNLHLTYKSRLHSNWIIPHTNNEIFRYPSTLTHRNIATVILHVPDNLEKHFSLDSLFYYQTLPFHCVSPLAQFEGEKDMRKDFVLHIYKSKFKR